MELSAYIRDDLTRVKDVLDIFVRTGMKQADDLIPQLAKMAVVDQSARENDTSWKPA